MRTVILVLSLGLFLSFFSVGCTQKNPNPNGVDTSNTESQASNLTDADDIVRQIQYALPENSFGGAYVDGNTIFINLKDLSDKFIIDSIDTKNYTVTVNEVTHSLKSLEEIKENLASHMSEYDIAALEVDVRQNKIHIELYEENNSVYDITDNLIDRSDVTVIVLPEGTQIKTT